MFQRNVLTAIFGVLFALAGPAMWAQGIITGTIGGSVQDSTGAVINGATVSAHNNDTGFDAKGVTTASGDFVLPDLAVGNYTLTVSSLGFSAATVNGLVVKSGISASAGVIKLSVTNAAAVEMRSRC
jgi:hypothetical protein